MNFFKRLFTPANGTECPRCLGKGHVDNNDIVRLGQQLKWKPGKCAYCSGKGKVNPEVIAKVPVDEAFLTIDMPHALRKRIINRDEKTLEQMRLRDNDINTLIQQIRELHFIQDLTAEEIVNLIVISNPERKFGKTEKTEMLEYVKQLIYQKD